MARDIKLNMFQHSAGQMRQRVLKYRRTLERVERELAEMDQDGEEAEAAAAEAGEDEEAVTAADDDAAEEEA